MATKIRRGPLSDEEVQQCKALLGNEVEPAALRRYDDARDEPVAALHVQLDPSVHVAGAGDALHLAGQQLGEQAGYAGRLHVTTVSAPMLCLSAAGVSRARILPWSMMATRSQSRSASSM